MKKYIMYIEIIVLSFITVLGFSMRFNLEEGKLTYYYAANTFIWVLLFAFYCLLSNKVMKIDERKLNITSIMTSIIISVFYIIRLYG